MTTEGTPGHGRPDVGISRVRVTVIGNVGVTIDGTPIHLAPSVKKTLALLVAVGDKGATKDWLAEELFPNDLADGRALDMRIARLRKALGLPTKKDKKQTGRYALEIDRAHVDAWHLLDLDNEHAAWHPAMAPYLEAVAAFTDIEEPSFAITAMAEAVAAAQRSAISKLSRLGQPASAGLLVSLARHLDSAPGNELLAAAVAQIHLDSGRTDDALAMVERCLAKRAAEGRPPSGLLEALRARLTGGTGPAPTVAMAPVGGGEAAAVGAPSPRLPSPVRPGRFRATHFVGRADALATLEQVLDPDQTGLVVIQARAASGKTALLGEVMQRAVDLDAYVVRVAGSFGAAVGLGPFSSALPAVRAMLAESQAPPADSTAGTGVLAAQLLARLEADAAGRRLLVVVDDAHWLDTVTCDVVNYLAHAAVDGALSVILAARPGETGEPWLELDHGLDRLPGLVRLTLEPLSVEDLHQLVNNKRPDLALPARAQLARWVHNASGGLPGVALALLDSDDGSTADNAVITDIYDRLVAPLAHATRAVGTASAVLGAPCRTADMAALLNQDSIAVDDAIVELRRRGLLTDTGDGTFEVAHQLIADALLRAAPGDEQARLHLRASEQATSIHQLARHQLAAGDLVDPALAKATVLASARRHLHDGAFWESVAGYRAAIEIGGDLDPEALVEFSTALSFAGQRARAASVRQRAYDAAVAVSRWDLAHDAATAALPVTEDEDGEHDRFRQLLAIPPGLLDERRQRSQALHLSRLAALCGDLDTARQWVERAEELAVTDNDQMEAALARRFVEWTTTEPAERQRTLLTATSHLTASLPAQCRRAQLLVSDQFEQGHLDEARRTVDDLLTLTEQGGDPWHRWLGLIKRSLLHETDGHWDKADAAADAALRYGQRHGIAPASILRLSQGYFRLRFTGDLAFLGPRLDQMPAPDGQSTMYQAARATILDACGHHDEAAAECRRLAKRALQEPSSAGFACLAILVPLLARYGSPSERAGTRDLLHPYRNSALVVAGGLANLGPAAHLIHQLERPTERAVIQGLRAAIRTADQFGMRSWQVRFRIDLAASTGARQPLEEAEALADGTALALLVARAASS